MDHHINLHSQSRSQCGRCEKALAPIQVREQEPEQEEQEQEANIGEASVGPDSKKPKSPVEQLNEPLFRPA